MDKLDLHAALLSFSAGEITALDLRQRLGGITYGDVFRLIADAGLSLPRVPEAGREETLARARSWLFPKASHDG